ncbi:hypothetical protein ABH935_000013 [Catenulispora sp. GAS73]
MVGDDETRLATFKSAVESRAASIAEDLERTGKSLLSTRFPRLAERAFDGAADIHARFWDAQAEDRCTFLTLVAVLGFAAYLLHLPRSPGATRSEGLFVTIQNFVNPISFRAAHSQVVPPVTAKGSGSAGLSGRIRDEAAEPFVNNDIRIRGSSPK